MTSRTHRAAATPPMVEATCLALPAFRLLLLFLHSPTSTTPLHVWGTALSSFLALVAVASDELRWFRRWATKEDRVERTRSGEEGCDDENNDRTDDFDDDGRKKRRRRRRPDGTSVGSCLVPLLVSSIAVTVTPSSSTTETDNTTLSETYADLASLAGLAFALSSLRSARGGVAVAAKEENADGGGSEAEAPRRSAIALVQRTAGWYGVALAAYAAAWVGIGNWNDETAATSATLAAVLIVGLLQSYLLLLYDDNGGGGGGGVIDALTPGEWIAVSSLLSFVLGDFALRYACWRLCGVVGEQSPFGVLSSAEWPESMTPHLAASHGGAVGCLLGCVASGWILPIRRGAATATKLASAAPFGARKVGRLVLIIAAAMACADVSLSRCCVETSPRDGPLFGTTGNAGSAPWWWRCVPRPLRWLLYFLLAREKDDSNGGSVETKGEISWIRPPPPRSAWLLYWAVTLALLLPPAAVFASRLPTSLQGEERRLTIVVSRKYFHLVAVFLFAPATWLAPEMMALSYAVAVALLIALESVRTVEGSEARMSSKVDGTIGRRSVDKSLDLTVHGASALQAINHFFDAFLDEKDSGASLKGGIVVTHIALVCGCAVPLWVTQVVIRNAIDPHCWGDSCGSVAFFLLPFIGIITLGVGDAAGAVVGILWGKTQWPGSRRTVEGSLAMLVSMGIFVGLLESISGNNMIEVLSILCSVTPLLLSVTSLEASTTQIDNLCLPLLGSSLLLLLRIQQ